MHRAMLLPVCGEKAEAQAVDPQSLLWEWSGTWTGASAPGMSGQFHMNIKSVDGNRVQGRIERSNIKAGFVPDFNFTGTVTGNVLRFQSGQARTELTIDGDRMSGQMFGTTRSDIALTKRK
jgi:hypothetical protein